MRAMFLYYWAQWRRHVRERVALDLEIDARVKAFLSEDPDTQVCRLARQAEGASWD